jgi:hypothetical protein
VGHNGEGRVLQGARRTGGMNEIRRQRRMRRLAGRTARNAEPVDPAIRTTHKGQCIVECELMTGT